MTTIIKNYGIEYSKKTCEKFFEIGKSLAQNVRMGILCHKTLHNQQLTNRKIHM